MISDNINNLIDEIENHKNLDPDTTQGLVIAYQEFEPKILELQTQFLERLENILQELNQ
tara:strand:+ start:7 stop:183 length:177 start_codon:yes stop_codon:yes gene_type:complete